MRQRSRRGSTLIEYILLAAIGAAAVYSGADLLGIFLVEPFEVLADTLAVF
jgi:Flp pilus assembly pilin Flp